MISTVFSLESLSDARKYNSAANALEAALKPQKEIKVTAEIARETPTDRETGKI